MGDAIEKREEAELAALPGWAVTASMAQSRYERLVSTAWGFSAGALVALAALAYAPGTGTAVFAALIAAVAVAEWGRVAWASTGRRRAMRRAHERWLHASGEKDALVAVVEGYRALVGSIAKLPPREATEKIVDLRDALIAAGLPLGEHLDAKALIDAVEQLEFRARMARAAADLAAQEARLAAVAPTPAGAWGKAQGVTVVGGLGATSGPPAPEDAAGARVVYPDQGPVPASSIGRPHSFLADLVDEAQRAAERGVVIESPTVGALLKEPARWSPYAAPVHLTRELLDLFEPATRNAPLPPPAPDPQDPPAETPQIAAQDAPAATAPEPGGEQ